MEKEGCGYMKQDGELQEQLMQFLFDYKRKIEEIVKERKDKPMPPLTEALFHRYEKTGNRLDYEEVYFERRKYLSAFGLLAVLNRDAEELTALQEILISICEEECWALPAHVDRKHNPDWRITIDLFAAETAQAVSELCFLLKEELPEELKKQVRLEVERRVFQPFYCSNVPYAFWEECTNNWNAVCAGAIGSASIYWMQEEPKRLESCLKRIVKALSNYLKGFSADGVCMEGLDYYTYGMTYFIGFAAQLKEYTKGSWDLLADQSMERIARFYSSCFFDGGTTVSFSDGSQNSYFKAGLACFLAQNVPGTKIPDLSMAAAFDSDSCFRFMANYRDILWTKNYLREFGFDVMQKSAGSSVMVFPDAQWCICKGEKKSGMAVKGGSNAEPHNHNDVGSFLYVLGADMLLADLGAGEYTADYFGEKRYDIFCNSSFSHNVPVINGKGQQAGTKYSCKEFFADGTGKIIMRLENAYQIPELLLFERTLEFHPKSGQLSVEDRFVAEGRLRVKENLVTQYPAHIKNQEIWIQGKESSCKITVEQPEVTIVCDQFIHKNHQGQKEDVFCLRWKYLNEDPGTKEWICRFVIEPAVRNA